MNNTCKFTCGKLTGAVLCIAFSAAAFADFHVTSPTWPKDGNSNVEQTEQLGNSTADSFESAVKGERGEITPEEMVYINERVPKKLDNRWIVRLGLGFGEHKVANLENSGESIIGETAVRVRTLREAQNTIEFAVGFNYKRWSIDFEHTIFDTPTRFNVTNFLQGRNEDIDGSVKSYPWVFNIFYNWDMYEFVNPYFGGIVGINFNKAKANFSGGNFTSVSTSSYSKFNPAIGIVLGLKGRIFSTGLEGFVNYKYMYLGKTMWQDDDNIVKTDGITSYFGPSLGLIYHI